MTSQAAFGQINRKFKEYSQKGFSKYFFATQELQSKKNVKTISGPIECTELIFWTLKNNSVSDKTAPLNVV